MACFKVRERAVGLAGCGLGASCGSGGSWACALKATDDSSATSKKQRKKSDLELGRVLSVM
jgi:hypothetical protein